MKKIGILQTAFTIAGCFFGAGFLSGQELWQFFGSFGVPGFLGVIISCLLLSLLTFLTINFSHETSITDMEKVIVPCNIKWLEKVASFLELSFLFCIYIIMIAGAGSLIFQITGNLTLKIVTCFLFGALITFISLKGLGSAVRFFDIVVPILIFITVTVVIIVLSKNDFSNIEFTSHRAKNVLIDNWLVSSLNFVSYNYFCIIAITASLGKHAKSTTSSLLGSLVACVLITTVAILILLALFAVPTATKTELPLLSLADNIGTLSEIAVTVALLFAMFGAAISVYVPVPEHFEKYGWFAKHKVLYTCLISIVAILLSLFEFSQLISIIYPVFGYISIFAIIGLFINNALLLKNKKLTQ